MTYRAVIAGFSVVSLVLSGACARTRSPPPVTRQPPAAPSQAGAVTAPGGGPNPAKRAPRRAPVKNDNEGGPIRAAGTRPVDNTNQVNGAASPRRAAKPTEPGASAGAAPPTPPGAATQTERQQALDRRFKQSLGRFDQRLARDDKQLAADEQTARQAAAAQQARAGAVGPESGGAAQPASDGHGKMPPNAQADGGGGDQADIAHSPPKDVPSGANDDVVARQLREAAENEDDPKLRAKLWDEYRKYKARQ